MAQVFTTSKRVEFRDTDAAGIMHFSAYFTYMEEAEHELLRSIGTSVVLDVGDDTLSWPRVAANAEYRGPVQFEDEMVIQVRIKRLGSRSVTYHHQFVVGDQVVALLRERSSCVITTSLERLSAAHGYTLFVW